MTISKNEESNFYKEKLHRNNRKIGLILRALRIDRRLTLVEFSNLIGVSKKTAMYWEGGKSLIPASALYDICMYLGANINDFYNLPLSSYTEIQKNKKKNHLKNLKTINCKIQKIIQEFEENL